jgi:succinate dehydrogenase/fumarate reductase flavoprotein subunit
LCEKWLAPLGRTGGVNPFALRVRLEKEMWLKVGVVRNGTDLRAAVDEIRAVRGEVDCADGSGGAVYNAKWNEALNLANMTVIAEMIATSALLREESRGAHYRQDFPEQDPTWFKNICMAPRAGELQTWTTPVQFPRLQPPDALRKPGRV